VSPHVGAKGTEDIGNGQICTFYEFELVTLVAVMAIMAGDNRGRNLYGITGTFSLCFNKRGIP
jgi:hypothetical protein